jgi:hypothetical protein
MYAPSNGVKPRFDGGGSEFGLMHRDLPPGYLMFDIDRMTAQLELTMEMRRENEGFVEYRRRANRITFVAMFEVKRHLTQYSEKALDINEANSLARLEMARLLGCRLFVVFATKGQQPFDFYEIDTVAGDPVFVGTLDYSGSDRIERCKLFWSDVLGIQRDRFS